MNTPNDQEALISKLTIGTKVFFTGEKQPFWIKANDGKRFVIATKPFNVQRTVIYTILDFQQGLRNRNNLIFNMYDYKIQEDIDKCMADLQSGEAEISHRRPVEIDILKIEQPKKKTK